MNFIVDDIGAVVEAMRQNTGDGTPYYLYGHRVEIANRLMEKDRSKSMKYKKYPLVALRMDVEETFADGLWEFDLNIALLHFTDKNYTAEERYTKVFKPVLYPMYQAFLDALGSVGLFSWENDQRYPEHTKIDRPFWGTTGENGNTAYMFSDPLDAIEILNLKIKKSEDC